MKHKLHLSSELENLVRHLPPNLKRQIRQAFDQITDKPTTGKTLTGQLEGFHGYRVGKTRIVYRITNSLLDVVMIGPRKTIYQQLARELSHQKGGS